MKARELAIPGTHEFCPPVFSDDRGMLTTPFQERALQDATGHTLFPVRQSTHSQSRRGVLRGVHFTASPPGMAKYVYCSSGSVRDIVVDVREGSPTFGWWDSVLLDSREFRALYLPVGLGHAFVALEDNTVMSYLLSEGYVPENELAVSPTDPALGLPLPDDLGPFVMSERDHAAPTLAEAQGRGLLPDYETCVDLEARLYR